MLTWGALRPPRKTKSPHPTPPEQLEAADGRVRLHDDDLVHLHLLAPLQQNPEIEGGGVLRPDHSAHGASPRSMALKAFSMPRRTSWASPRLRRSCRSRPRIGVRVCGARGSLGGRDASAETLTAAWSSS